MRSVIPMIAPPKGARENNTRDQDFRHVLHYLVENVVGGMIPRLVAATLKKLPSQVLRKAWRRRQNGGYSIKARRGPHRTYGSARGNLGRASSARQTDRKQLK